MSADRPTGGDGIPDRFSGREDRPFPGAPEEREPVPELPRNTLSMEEVRAVHRRSGSNAEFEAAARAHAQAQAAGSSDSPGPKALDQGVSGERSAEAAGERTVPGTRPGAQDAGADGFERPDRAKELPPFPGAPEERGPAPELPRNTLSMEEVRVLHQRSNSNAEFEAMAAQYAAATKETSTPGADGVRSVDARDGFFGRTEDLQDQGAPEPGERKDGEHDRVDARMSMDTLQQAERGEGSEVEKDGDGQREDGREQKSSDLVQVQYPAPEAETGRPGEVASEAAPDRQPDDPRITAMERQMERMMATVEAMQEKLEASEARNDALETKLTAAETRIGELETQKTQREARNELGRPVDGGEEPQPLGSPEITEAGKQRDELSLGDVAGTGGASQDDLTAYDSRIADRADQEANREPDSPERSGFDEAGQSALGAAGALGLVNPVLALAVSADSARRNYDEMSPDGKYEANSMLETYVTAVGSMPPETAVLAVTAAAVLPTLHGRLQGFIDKYRRKD